MGYRYGGDPVVLQPCSDCGCYVADQAVHDGWHANHPPVPDDVMTALMEAASHPSGPRGGGLAPPFAMGVPPGSEEFSRLLFTVAQDHLDPGHERMRWSPGFTGTAGSLVKEYGMKFAWAAPDDTGMGMVYVAVGNIPQEDRLPCGQYDNPGPSVCRTGTMPDGSPAQLLTNVDRLEVHWPRPDGSYVFGIVDATFRNNSLTPTSPPLPTMNQLMAFVMDPRLLLP